MNTLALGPSWLDPDYLLNTFGLPGLLLIVFAESGLAIGFFLPGDSLLFTTGLLVTTGDLKYPLWLVCVLVALAAIIGDQVGYLFGRKVGPALFKRPDSRLFKQENVEKAHDFFEKYGPKSLVLARFVPIVRTFTPIIAGVSRMNYRSFITFNIIGGILWGVGVTVLGAALGKIDFVHENIEMILILIVLISVLPIVFEFLRARSKSKKEGVAQQGGDQGRPDGPHSGAGTDSRTPAAYAYTGEQAAPYASGQAAPYDNGQGGRYGEQGGRYGGGQGGQYGGGQGNQYGAPQDGRYGNGQGGRYDGQGGHQYDGGQADRYGSPQGQYGGQGGQYGGGQYAPSQDGPYGAPQDGRYAAPPPGGQYGAPQGGQYGGANQGGQYSGQYGGANQGGQYGGQYGAGGQYGGADQGGRYGGQYGAEDQNSRYGDAGRSGQYGGGQAAPHPGQEDDPGQYGWQDRR
ncbi:DedA family protein [Streptomyces sp. NPDC014623]|uniref:DedA family protein n=1 Tax=Streptomyces sp. NPDC014623 TaxID=3364875 RepID=UPI0037032A85